MLLEIENALWKIENKAIYDSFVKTIPKLDTHKSIVCMISGGSDSDIMIDILTKLDKNRKIKYVFVSTGLEYKATINHISYLKDKYGVQIETVKPILPIPLSCKIYGIPFFSKYVSEMMYRLQTHNFDFANDGKLPYEELIIKYPKCKTALLWWCNKNGDKSRYNISKNKLMKEYIIAHPPDFKISQKCCFYAKKEPAKQYKIAKSCDMDIVGVRRDENGIRSTQYKNCFSTRKDKQNSWDSYRMLFWYSDEDKRIYKETFRVKNSDCYEIWGMCRTGCVGCPFSSNFTEELKTAKRYEPNMYKAMINIFGKSYEYKKKYLKFKKQQKGNFWQSSIFDKGENDNGQGKADSNTNN